MDSSQGLNSLKQIKTSTKGGEICMEKEQPLSPMARLFHEPGSNVYIVSMMGCKTKIKPDVIKESLVNSILRHPRFSSLQTSDLNAIPTLAVSKDSGYIKITSFWSILEVFWNSLVAVMMFVFTVLFLKDTETPLKGSLGVENRPRRFVSRSVSLADIKAVKNAMNVTLNDVVLGVTQAGLSCYLNRRYSKIKGLDYNSKKDVIPKNIRLRATFFFNLRATTRIDVSSVFCLCVHFLVRQTLVEKMKTGKMGQWGNKIGYVLLPFTIGLKSNPLDYVKEAKAVIDRKKASLEPLYTYFVLYVVLKLFGMKAAGKLNHKVFFNTTLWFTNVPGPQEEVTFYGHDIAYMAPSCYGQPNALMIHIVSYIDKLTFVISADEETIPDPQQLCDDLEESLDLIKSSALGTESAKNK
ncbi:O-acyltransferase, WSD1 domain-containing protein [Artemisia annua]|uniref:O-acyltransferase, WSD1 domain-containing protein n=1 Tax=Artemisia annua TaxID=35608 RepID=A0A2U1PR78_ARTAN|nr:O-acyltransferase, WSD1 domain-containing protein [Artemisia annua]